MNLREYDLILINTSGGKDSSVAALRVAQMAQEQGVKDRLLLVHATFEEEWDGVIDIIHQQAEQLGLPVEVVSRGEGLLDYVRRRRMWPSSQARYCTSDFKRAPIDKVITRRAPWLEDHPSRVLNVMGIRAQESPARAKRVAFERDERRTNGRRVVDNWYPIFDMKLDTVWEIIRKYGIPQHKVYEMGIPRLACVFCIFSPKAALVLSGKHNQELLRKYVAVEKEIGHDFREGFKIADVLREVEEGGPVGPISDWKM
jgi:3'-phosphoadenosine 5'-phosphosulfate sulfotransferase (PAPS reductase)/FAD synthetase